ncbi:glycoside hydrolase family 52 protein, partial [Aeromicrobium sp. PE09-221]|uniref:glycoside hydrolase family 52 protein n=1 Tax=Aeromicrobium sp. PE09-221 TaxID=1898043 RepID=UPI0011227FA6
MNNPIVYNAHHSPMGAYASFTLGYHGAKGGLGLELDKPADQQVYIGFEAAEGGYYESLPFFGAGFDESRRFDVEKEDDGKRKKKRIIPYASQDVSRAFNLSTDTWSTKELSFTIYSPAHSIPDPAHASDHELMDALVPAVFAELTLDNRNGKQARCGFISYKGNASEPYSHMRKWDHNADGKLRGIGVGRSTAIVSMDEDVMTAQGFNLDDILSERFQENWTFALGATGALLVDVPAGQCKTYRFAICFYRGGLVTTGIDAAYYYTRYFSKIEEVAEYALTHFDRLTTLCNNNNRLLDQSALSDDQKFMLAHAIHSYYGNTELLIADGKPLWIVNEGEYRMMNTLDLTVDQLFFELEMNPWTVKNVLDQFTSRYSYIDTLQSNDGTEYEGGISFTHDMGVMNQFSRPQHSCYEKYGIRDCFSHMTHEQLVNWVSCATVYVAYTKDVEWLHANASILQQCFQSMVRRDHPDPTKRNGMMSFDSSRTMGGAEITTYDSLDVSLGQARNNIYIAGKCWASYVGLANIFTQLGWTELAIEAEQQAKRTAATITAHLQPGGYIPAVIGENNDSRIIPAIEGLIFPYYTGCKEALAEDGPYGE